MSDAEAEVALADRPVDARPFIGAVAVAVVSLATTLMLGADRLDAMKPAVGVLLGVVTCAMVIAAYLLRVHAAAIADPQVRWVADGIGCAAVVSGMVVLGFPSIAPGGGLLGTSSSGIAGLVVLSHLAVGGFALGGMLGLGDRARWLAIGSVLAMASVLACDAVLMPTLVEADLSYTYVLGGIAALAGMVVIGGLAVWFRHRVGNSNWSDRWVELMLCIGCLDLAQYLLAGQRFGVLWWGSLMTRSIGSVVVVAGLLRGVAVLYRRLGFDTDRLAHQARTLQEIATTDPLTGLLNRRELERLVEVVPVDAWTTPLTVLFLDLDDLKLVNDLGGHEAGDELIGDFASLLRRTVRSGDLVARAGGDEFVVVMPGADGPAAMAVLGRMRLDAASDLRFSAGMATSQGPDVDLGALVRVADDDMYVDKRERSGRGR